MINYPDCISDTPQFGEEFFYRIKNSNQNASCSQVHVSNEEIKKGKNVGVRTEPECEVSHQSFGGKHRLKS